MNTAKKEQIEAEKLMIHQQLIFELQDMMDDMNLSSKDLAKTLNVSKSYISQLFHGNKLLNVEVLAKIMLAFDKKFTARFAERKPECDIMSVINLKPSINHHSSMSTLFDSGIATETKYLEVRTGTDG